MWKKKKKKNACGNCESKHEEEGATCNSDICFIKEEEEDARARNQLHSAENTKRKQRREETRILEGTSRRCTS